MELLSALPPVKKHMNNKGFTLVEVLIVIGLLIMVFAFGLFISFDFYRSYSFYAESDVIVSILQKARNQSLNNINQARHGVYFDISSDDLKYVIFECDSENHPQCTDYNERDESKDLVIESSYGMSITPESSFSVVFEQLSGSCASPNCLSDPLIITLSDGRREYEITINNEGAISW